MLAGLVSLMISPRAIAGALSLLLLTGPPVAAQNRDFVFVRFARYLEALRVQAGIPGMAAAVATGDQTIWAQGFGLADIEAGRAATPDTPFHVGDLTQLFSATAVLACVDRASVALDDPISQYADNIPEGSATVRHVLSHTSAGTPGAAFRYDPGRFTAVAPIVEQCAGDAFREILARDILHRLAMQSSVPGHDVGSDGASDAFDSATLQRYARVLAATAKPYSVDRRGRPTPSSVALPALTASTGLVSTVGDLARFTGALDDGVLLDEATLRLAWTPMTTPDGARLPHGLGWFTQTYNGTQLVWHFGVIGDAYSSLIVKVPARDLTFIVLATSDRLNSSFPLAGGDVTTSLFATLFLRLFII